MQWKKPRIVFNTHSIFMSIQQSQNQRVRGLHSQRRRERIFTIITGLSAIIICPCMCSSTDSRDTSDGICQTFVTSQCILGTPPVLVRTLLGIAIVAATPLLLRDAMPKIILWVVIRHISQSPQQSSKYAINHCVKGTLWASHDICPLLLSF